MGDAFFVTIRYSFVFKGQHDNLFGIKYIFYTFVSFKNKNKARC
jgi:hypothetical protein